MDLKASSTGLETQLVLPMTVDNLLEPFTRMGFVPALAMWTVVWLALLIVPPGHKDQQTVIRMNMIHGIVATVLSFSTILLDWQSGFCTAATVAFFLVDMANMALCDLGGSCTVRDSKLRRVEYFHHIIGTVYGVFLLYGQGLVCADSCPAKNLYTYAQTNEVSTPFYSVFRMTKRPAHGQMFAAVFFLSRIVWNFCTLVPHALNHCSFAGFVFITAPYQLMQIMWMGLIIKKGMRATRRNGRRVSGIGLGSVHLHELDCIVGSKGGSSPVLSEDAVPIDEKSHVLESPAVMHKKDQ